MGPSRAAIVRALAILVACCSASAGSREWKRQDGGAEIRGQLAGIGTDAVEIYDYLTDTYVRRKLSVLSAADREHVARNRKTIDRAVEAWAPCFRRARGGSDRGGDRTPAVLRDKWGRDVTGRGVVLLDWEGHMGNPEVEHTVQPPRSLACPVSLKIRTKGRAPLLYFIDGRGVLMSEHDERGPTLTHTFEKKGEPLRARLAVQPDRDSRDEQYELMLEFAGADRRTVSVAVPVYVCDQDCDRAADFRFFVDTSHDATGFYRKFPRAEKELQQICDDVAYYLDDQGFDEVPAGGAAAPVDFRPRKEATNAKAFKGFYLFSTGWRHGTRPNDIWSTGYPGKTRATRGGVELPVYCVGGVRPHPDGDRSEKNTKGWAYFTDDEDWWKISRMRKRDDGTEFYHVSFYSVQKHELLHALAYEPRFPIWRTFADKLAIDDKDVMAYTGRATPMRKDRAHAWDPVLHKRQWNQGVEMIDKFEMLVMQAVGWRLRITTPFVPPMIRQTALAPGKVGQSYKGRVRIFGGVPPYRFGIAGGALPPGLTLNGFDGTVEGTPTKAGRFTWKLHLNDAGPDNTVRKNGTKRSVTLVIE